jgi:hypothetical protein
MIGASESEGDRLTTRQASSRALGLRLLVFLALAAFICLGPAYRQVLRQRSDILRHWTMFHGFGSQICDVRYVRHRGVGEGEAVDRFALLADAQASDDANGIRTIRSVERAEEIGRQLCERLPPGERDLRLVARCGSKQGWKAASDGSRNLCAPLEPNAASASR